MERRDFLKWLGLGAAGVTAMGSGLFGLLRGRGQAGTESAGHYPHAHSESGGLPAVGANTAGHGNELIHRTGNSYGGMMHPPAGLALQDLCAFERPMGATDEATTLGQPHLFLPPFNPARTKPRRIDIETVDRPLNVAHAVSFNAWTFNNTVPGPVIRATEGDVLDIHFHNRTEHPHSLHFHGTHSVNQDGWEPIPPGGSTRYVITAGPTGLHPYHCHVPPLDLHMARGLFGALIVDPPGGRPPAHEVVLILHGYDLKDRGQNDICCWNGIAGFYDRFPIRVPVGQLVRLYLVNMLEYEPVASFHLHAQTFDVYRSGTKLTPDDHTDVVTLGQTERAILEFRLPERGRYMFHPHQSHLAVKGSMGWFVAV